MTKNKRISRAKRNNVLNDMYGKLYDSRKARINYPRNNHERKLLSTINELYKIKVELFKQTKGKQGIRDEMHIAQMDRIKKLNVMAVSISESLSRDTVQTIITVDQNKLDEINGMVEGFNDYMIQNQLVKFAYEEMQPILLPQDVITYRKIRRNDSYQVKILSNGITPLDNTGMGDIDKSSITPSSDYYNKKESKEYEQSQRDYWLCKKCGFGHMLFEVI
jgi:hypothetical protein|tara:strand:+ start:159 stop:818 length:660 start_codon:yes stop_codon:yes gene_type:complete